MSPVATPTDVRDQIDTDADDSRITSQLELIGRRIDRQDAADKFADEAHRRDFESIATALRLASRFDRTVSQSSLGPSSETYETEIVSELRSEALALDPTDGALVDRSIIRDSDRTISTGN